MRGVGVEGAAGGAGFGSLAGYLAAMGVPLGALLGTLVLVDGGCPLVHEVVAQGAGDDQRVDGSVEAAIAARLEAVQEQHDLAHLEVGEFGDDDSCQLRHLVLVHLVPHAAVFPQVIELGQQPHGGGLVVVGSAQGHQRGRCAKECPVHMLGAIVLHGGVHRLHERLQARMGR